MKSFNILVNMLSGPLRSRGCQRLWEHIFTGEEIKKVIDGVFEEGRKQMRFLEKEERDMCGLGFF
jgi:hypothetical protein